MYKTTAFLEVKHCEALWFTHPILPSDGTRATLHQQSANFSLDPLMTLLTP